MKSDYKKIIPNIANAQDHIPEAKKNMCTIRERVRTQYHQLPYKNIPKVMIKFLVMESARKLNFFPQKGSISEYYSPRNILHQSSLEYKKHCSYPFATYVQACHETNPTNTNAP